MLVFWLFLLTNYNVYEAIAETAECRENVQPQFHILGSGGTRAQPKMFPFMAALGYGNKTNMEWLCGGSLISDRFVLTAAHCLYSLELGIVQWVRLGDLDLNTTNDQAQPQDFDIVDIYPHPEYKRSIRYHDIALLKLDKIVVYNDYILPACLQLRYNLTAGSEAWALGWGDLNVWGDKTTHLMKVELRIIKHANCDEKYRQYASRRLMNGIMHDTQICAGNTNGRDTCPGDSGGPLLVPWSNRVFGITSFGSPCGIGNTIGVYTRVLYYLSFIESVIRNKDN